MLKQTNKQNKTNQKQKASFQKKKYGWHHVVRLFALTVMKEIILYATGQDQTRNNTNKDTNLMTSQRSLAWQWVTYSEKNDPWLRVKLVRIESCALPLDYLPVIHVSDVAITASLQGFISIGVLKNFKHIIENNTNNKNKNLHIWWVSVEKFFQLDFAD